MRDLQFPGRFIKLINLKLQKRSTYIKDLQFSCQVPATYVKEIYKANSNQTQKLQKLQHYQRNLTNMNAATHIYQRIKPQHLSNFINHSPKREIEWVFGLRLMLRFPFFIFFLCMNSNLTWIHCLRTVYQCLYTVYILKNIKNGSHGIIHTFKNYFATVLSVFNFQCQQQ